jgi:predicted small secreted protein
MKNKKPMRLSMTKLCMAVAVMATLAGCNTVNGVGQDISGGATMVSGEGACAAYYNAGRFSHQ